MQIYLKSCNEGTAVTVFLRVDVVGRDGAGKTSLTKSLTLQRFDPNELSTRGVVFDPKCQIIVEEACNWTSRLTTKHYTDIYDRNITTSVAQALDTRAVRSKYFSSKEKDRSSGIRRKQPKKVDGVPDVSKSTGVLVGSGGIPDTSGQSDDESNAELQRLSVEPASMTATTSVLQSEQAVTDVINQIGPSTTNACHQMVTDTNAVKPIVLDTNDSMHLDTQCTSPGKISPQSDNSDSLRLLSPDLSYTKRAARKRGSKERMTGNCSPNNNTGRDAPDSQSTAVAVGSACTNESLLSVSNVGSPTEEGDDPPQAKRPNLEVVGTFPLKQPHVQPSVLPANIKQRVSDLLRNKTSLRKAQQEIFVTILDYAGQNVFYATHRLLMAKTSFYYVVFDASKPLEAKTPSIFRVEGDKIHIIEFDKEVTNYDRLEEWIAAIHIMEDDQSRPTIVFEGQGILSPAMFLIGTHADELKEQPGLLERQESFLRSKLEGTELCKHIVWASKDRMCFYVDNTLTNPDTGVVDPQVLLLRQVTEEVARRVAQQHKLPITWLKFEEEVRAVKEQVKMKRTASVEELLQLAMESAGIKNKEELEVLLRYLSRRAVLLYHPNALKNGEDEVVLDVEWLTLQLEKVITIRTEVLLPILQEDVKRSKKKGIVTEALIRHLLSDSGSAQVLIISLMSSFDLLCPYSGINAEHMEEADNQKDFINIKKSEESLLSSSAIDKCSDCFIPCLLEKKSPLESDLTSDSCKTMPLLFQSVCGIRMPQPLYYRLLTRLCKRFPRLPVLNRNVGYFHVYPGHRLEFSLDRYSLKMIVLTKTDVSVNSLVCSRLRQLVVMMVNDAKKEGMSGLRMQLGYQQSVHGVAPSQSDSVSPDFVSLEGYLDTRYELYCHSTSEEVSAPLKLALWYPNLKQEVRLIVLLFLHGGTSYLMLFIVACRMDYLCLMQVDQVCMQGVSILPLVSASA